MNAISKGKMIYGLLGFISAGVLFTSGTVSADSSVHVVKEGDTLSEIAYDNDISLNKLAEDNNIENVNIILIGDKIILDGKVDVQSTNTDVVAQSNDKDVEVVADKPETVAPQANSSVYEQFVSAGGTQELWDAIVIPESGGDPSATNGKYYGLFQGDISYGWPTGDVATQTKGAIDYAVKRYGSVSNAIAFRTSHNYW